MSDDSVLEKLAQYGLTAFFGSVLGAAMGKDLAGVSVNLISSGLEHLGGEVFKKVTESKGNHHLHKLAAAAFESTINEVQKERNEHGSKRYWRDSDLAALGSLKKVVKSQLLRSDSPEVIALFDALLVGRTQQLESTIETLIASHLEASGSAQWQELTKSIKNRFFVEFQDHYKLEQYKEGRLALERDIAWATQQTLQENTAGIASFTAEQHKQFEAILGKLQEVADRGIPGEWAPQLLSLRKPSLEFVTFDYDAAGIHPLGRFDFRHPRTAFFGYGRLMKDLKLFLEPRPRAGWNDVSWCILTGPSGSGKSRLANELCRFATEHRSMDAGFLPRANVDEESWRVVKGTWTVEKDTLVVIDYAASQAEDVRALLRRYGMKNVKAGARLRVLLLEAPIAPRINRWWQRDLFGPTGGGRDYVEQSYYLPPGRAKPRRVEDMVQFDINNPVYALDDDSRAHILRTVLKEAGIPESGQPTRTPLLDGLRLIDPLSRPLFALLYAEVLAAGLKDPARQAMVRIDNQLELLWEIIDRHFDRCQSNWKNELDLVSSHVNLLLLASLVDSLKVQELESIYAQNANVPSPRARRGEAPLHDELYRDLTIGHYEDLNAPLPGLKPSMLAQALLLGRLRARSCLRSEQARAVIADTQDVLQHALEIRPRETLWFLARTFYNFENLSKDGDSVTSPLLDALSNLILRGGALKRPEAVLTLATFLKRRGRDDAAARVLAELGDSDEVEPRWRTAAKFVVDTQFGQQFAQDENSTRDVHFKGPFAEKLANNLGIDVRSKQSVLHEQFERFNTARDLVTERPSEISAADKAALTTFLMMSAWGPDMRFFGGKNHSDKDRQKIFTGIYEKMPDAMQILLWRHAPRTLLMSDDGQTPWEHRIDVGWVRGVSLIFPVNTSTYGNAFMRGERSLYELSAKHILSPDEEDERNKPLFIIDLVLVLDGLFDLFLRQEIHSIFDGWDSHMVADITERVDLLSTLESEQGAGLHGFGSHFQSLCQRYKQRPVVVAPFTGRGLGEPFARRWRRGGAFELQGHTTADKDMLYVLKWDEKQR